MIPLPLGDNIRSRTTPVVTRALILTCCAVFVYEYLHPHFVDQWAFKPAYLLSHKFFQVGPARALESIIVSCFLHGGLLHIAGNMLFLWVFGDNVEDRMGHLHFLVFYLVCGVVATLTHSVVAVFGLVSYPKALEIGLVGASGAIAGVLGAYLVLYPGASIRFPVILIFFIFFIWLPAWLVIPVWFIVQLFHGVGELAGAGAPVAYWAHVGGFVLGLLWGASVAGRRRRPRPNPRVLNLDVRDL